MNKIEMILWDFYNCINIPIQFIDVKNNTINKVGFSDSVEKIIDNLGLYDEIKNFKKYNDKINYDNVQFITLSIENNDFYAGYFIIGPFTSNTNYSTKDIPFKPYYCVDIILNLLKRAKSQNLTGDTSFSQYVLDSIRYIHNYYYDDIRIDDLCTHLCLNKSYFCTIFKKETGNTFSTFLNKFRVEKSKKLLLDRNLSIMDVAMAVGYNNHNYFSIVFKKYSGYTPLEYRNEFIKLT